MAEDSRQAEAPRVSAVQVTERPAGTAVEWRVGVDHPAPLPSYADAGEIYHAGIGRSRKFDSFQSQLDQRMGAAGQPGSAGETRDKLQAISQTAENGPAGINETVIQAHTHFNEIAYNISPQIQDIIVEMKKLGISRDMLMPETFSLLAYGIKTDMWGETQTKDFPSIEETYKPDPDNPLNEVTVDADGKVQISTLNPNLQTAALRDKLQQLYDELQQLKKTPELAGNPQLRQWVESQAVSRSILAAKNILRIPPPDLSQATFVKSLSKEKLGEGKQVSNDVQVWQTAEGRRLIVKQGDIAQLRAEVMENLAMVRAGIPVPEASLQTVTGEDGQPKTVMVLGFLEQYDDPEEKFRLAQKYHNSDTIQKGMLIDLWFGQYNRRAHNIMMKDGKVAFIDNGGALFSRATGSYKGFSSEVDMVNLWDNLRTIPDDDPNGDEEVNEAYGHVMTVEGGPNGRLIVRDPHFLRGQLQRLGRFGDEQVAEMVTAVGYKDGPESIAEIQQWMQDAKLQKRLALAQKDPATLTPRDRRDLRWAQEAMKTFEAAIAAGGMKTYLTRELIARRDNLIRTLEPEVARAEKRQAIASRFWAAMDLVSAHNPSGNYNFRAALEILGKSLTDPQSIPAEGYPGKVKPETIEALRRPLPEGVSLDAAALQQALDEAREHLMETTPELLPASVDAIADIANMTDAVLWSLGDMDDQDSTLPPGMISTARMQGSGHQEWKIIKSQLVSKVRERRGKNGYKSDLDLPTVISADKFSRIPELVQQMKAAGHDQIVIFDDSRSSLEKAYQALQAIPESERPAFTLVLVNQGRKYTDSPQPMEIADPKGSFQVISARNIDSNDAMAKAPALIREMLSHGGSPGVLIDFDGVATNNGLYRQRQEQDILEALEPHLK